MEKKQEVQDPPKLGSPAPPIDPHDVPGLIADEKPKLKRKNRSAVLPVTIFAAVVAIIVVRVLVSVVIVDRHSDSLVAAVGDDRIEPPATLPVHSSNDVPILPFGTLSETWDPGVLNPLAWHTWTYTAKLDETITISVNPISDGFIPILGLYDSDGRLIISAQEDRMAPQKSLVYTFTRAGTYTILVSNIGGAAGKYTIMAQVAR